MLGKLIFAGVTAALSAALFVLIAESSPTTAELDADLAVIQREISQAKTRSDAFAGGLIKSLIEVRIEILSSTQALLEAKRASILRRVNLSFHIDGSEFKSKATPEAIQVDLAVAQKRAAAAEAEAEKYAGGMLLVLQRLKVVTEEVTVAQINSAYYSSKYGLPSIGSMAPKSAVDGKSSVPAGNVVKDKDAL